MAVLDFGLISSFRLWGAASFLEHAEQLIFFIIIVAPPLALRRNYDTLQIGI
jgi:hypothetical protein